MDRLITKKEVGALLGLHPESVMRLVRQGEFPSPIRIGGGLRSRVRFAVPDIKAWLETRKQRQAIDFPVGRSETRRHS